MKYEEIKGFAIDFVDAVREAQDEAVRNGIEANLLLINKKFAKTSQFAFITGEKSVVIFPPMICGLEPHIVSGLPDSIGFCIFEGNTERDLIIRQARSDTARDIIDTIRCCKSALNDDLEIALEGLIGSIVTQYGLEVEE